MEAPFNFRILLPVVRLFRLQARRHRRLGRRCCSATWLVLTRTRIGLVMRATQYDRETAQAFGIPVDRVYAGVFALGAMLAAIAAVLIVPISRRTT